MGRLLVFCCRILSLGVVGFFVFFGVSRAEAAASLYLAPASGSFTLGSTFTVSVYVNTGGQAINAESLDISFPPDKLQVVSPSTGKSFIQIWVVQPSYSNARGTISFKGAIPTPGINTEAGLISTIAFRVVNIGTAAIRIQDTSQVLLNDGRGTNVLGQKTDGIYYLVLPPPEGPIVTSRTNPDQESWYSNKTVSLEWVEPFDIQGYSYALDQNLTAEPDDISEGFKTRVVYNNLADGTYYFHIKALRAGAWGGTTDYILHIDTTLPASFPINISPSNHTSNHRPIIDFATTDAVSGIDHYEIKIISLDAPTAYAQQNTTPFFIEVTPPYAPLLNEGRYKLIVRALDRAENAIQKETNLTITKPLFGFIQSEGLPIGDIVIIPWPYVILLVIFLIILLGYFARKVWRWHHELKEHLERDIIRHPKIASQYSELKDKQKEYGSGGKGIGAAILFLALALGLFGSHVRAQETNFLTSNVPLEPPVVTLFPQSISNDEILYIGGRAGAPQAQVLIYLQNTDTGSTLNEAAVTDKNGAWFYSFPQFLDAGHYIAWTQLKIADNASPPSSRMDLVIGKTAVQFGSHRLSYETLYFAMFIVVGIIFLILLIFVIYHGYHVRRKGKHLKNAVLEAEESIRRGFSILRRDIERELSVLHNAQQGRELSSEERLREEKLLHDLDHVGRYIGKEVWNIEHPSKQEESG